MTTQTTKKTTKTTKTTGTDTMFVIALINDDTGEVLATFNDLSPRDIRSPFIVRDLANWMKKNMKKTPKARLALIDEDSGDVLTTLRNISPDDIRSPFIGRDLANWMKNHVSVRYARA